MTTRRTTDPKERRRSDPAHAAGKKRRGPPPERPTPVTARPKQRQHQPWVPTSGLVGRKRRSARRS